VEHSLPWKTRFGGELDPKARVQTGLAGSLVAVAVVVDILRGFGCLLTGGADGHRILCGGAVDDGGSIGIAAHGRGRRTGSGRLGYVGISGNCGHHAWGSSLNRIPLIGGTQGNVIGSTERSSAISDLGRFPGKG
jgi:hypothetical protein